MSRNGATTQLKKIEVKRCVVAPLRDHAFNFKHTDINLQKVLHRSPVSADFFLHSTHSHPL